jgi:hypothetical protein
LVRGVHPSSRATRADVASCGSDTWCFESPQWVADGRMRMIARVLLTMMAIALLSGCGLTTQQTRILSDFKACAPPGAYITSVAPDGQFKFESTDMYDAYVIKKCLMKKGYWFTS